MAPQQGGMTEQELLNELLGQEKQVITQVAEGIREASCRDLRKLLAAHFAQAVQDEYELLDKMREKGYYLASDASREQVQQLRNALKNMEK
ncbi:MAG: spore coat protein [Christensenellaceae bacterium]|nr:spore coat protein [Christensenellaceae bacterium]